MSTKREQYLALQKGMGQPVPELQIGDMPEETVYIWNLFGSIRHGTEGAITYSQIKTYCEVMSCSLLPFEIDIIVQLDCLHRRVNSE